MVDPPAPMLPEWPWSVVNVSVLSTSELVICQTPGDWHDTVLKCAEASPPRSSMVAVSAVASPAAVVMMNLRMCPTLTGQTVRRRAIPASINSPGSNASST